MIPKIGAGHGGLINGKYQTKGKRWFYEDGKGVYEGEFNRDIKARVFYLLNKKDIPYIDLVPEQKDISLKERVRRADLEYYKNNKDTFYVSIHSNIGSTRGTGGEVAISKNASSKSKRLAEISRDKFKEHFPQERWRRIIVKNYRIVKETACPTIIIECFFMDNREDFDKYIDCSDGRGRVAAWIVDIIETFINEYK